MAHRTRIMYIECKGDDIVGPARIGRVTFSKTEKSLSYAGHSFSTLAGYGFKANYVNDDTGEQYWISGCKKDGSDALYSTTVEIEEDEREEYWAKIRNQPEMSEVKSFRRAGKYSR